MFARAIGPLRTLLRGWLIGPFWLAAGGPSLSCPAVQNPSGPSTFRNGP